MADNTPNFDSMTPEEIMAWMESLAKRQGANEGFTTSADLEIPEIDPDSVVIDEPGYVPSEGKDKGKRIEPIVTRRPAAAPPPPPVQQPVAVAPPPPPPVVQAPPPPVAAAPAAASGTPDFNSMSPEEMMRWMETLAQRQGVDESTLVTGGGAEIGYVDPDTKVDWNYTPPEGSKAAKEEAARKAQPQPVVQAPPKAAPPPPPVVQAPPPPVAAAPAPEPAAAGGLSWLESLAADQGGDFPGLDLSFVGAELPPAAVAPEPLPPADPLNWLENLVKSEGVVEPQMTVPAAAPPPLETANPMDWLSGLSGSEGVNEPPPITPAAAPHAPEPHADALDWLGDLSQSQIAPEPAASGAADDPIAWLESLARRQKDVREDELTTPAIPPPPLPETPAADGPGYKPYSFDEPATLVPAQEAPAPAAASDFSAQDPSAWLDALASAASGRAPLPGDLHHTPAAPPPAPEPVPEPVAIPEPVSAAPVEPPPAPEPAPEPQTEDIGAALARGELVSSDMMAQWMSSQLAIGATREEPEELHGDYDPDAEPVKAELPDWLLEQVGPPVLTEEAPPAPEPAPFPPALIDAIVEPPAVENMPDWLRGDDTGGSELDDIFVPTSAPMPAALEAMFSVESIPDAPAEDVFAAPPAAPVADVFAAPPAAPAAINTPAMDPNLDSGDPWVVAFEQEYQQKIGGDDFVPPVPVAAVPAPVALAEAALPPETQLPAGESEAVPGWLGGVLEEAQAVAEPEYADEEEVVFEEVEAEAEAVQGDLPDWLMGSQPVEPEPVVVAAPALVVSQMPAPHDTDAWLQDLNPDTEVPSWLTEVISTSEHSTVVMQPPPAPAAPQPVAPAAARPAPQPQPIPQAVARPVPVQGASPAPVLPQVAAIDVRAALQSARTQVEAGQVDEALANYEQVIRANTQLDDVVGDLTRVVEKVKNNPAVFRVLGDGLMRQGKLQAALDTYRKALNQL